jgi:threonine synthase
MPWRTPDWYVQAVSGGLGPVGVLKGFRELEQFGLSEGVPKIAGIQSSGCDPMVRSFHNNEEDATPILQPKTRIATVATGSPGLAYKLLRHEMLEHGGTFESVSDDDAYQALKTVAQLEGISVEPATALAFAGLFKMARARMFDPNEIVVVNCSGHTFPVEKHILGSDIGQEMDVSSSALEEIPTEGLLSALEEVDTRVGQVVVIEDDEAASTLMTRILQANGAQHVHQAFDGQAGIELVQKVHPDLIILDLMMPNIDGFGVLDRLKADEALRNVPVVVVTAKDLTNEERARLSGQVQSLLSKGSFIDDVILQDLLKEKLR